MHFSEREAVCSNKSIHCAKWIACCFFVNAVVSEIITSFESALSYLQAFTSNSYVFLWKSSRLSKQVSLLCEVNGVLFHFLNVVVSKRNLSFENALSNLQAFTGNSHAFLWNRSSSAQTLQLTVRRKWSVASLSKCCTFRENHFL